MKRLLGLVVLAVFAGASGAAGSQSTSMNGIGPHGYDGLIGRWSCTNSVPSPVGGPRSSTVTVTRTGASDALFYRVIGKNFDSSLYITYSPKTKSWLSPSAYADGSSSFESGKATGNKMVLSGPFYDAGSGKTVQIRDTLTFSPRKTTDFGEYRSGAVWKAQYNVVCTKS